MADKETKENVLERIRERRAATRRKRMKRLVKVCGALVILALVLAFLYPHLQVMWQIDKARGADAETRKAALQWLADNDVRSATGVFVEALNSSRGESRIAEKALKKFKDPSVVPELLKIWKDTEARTYARYSALQLVAEMGGRELMDTFTDPLAILSDGWESSYDFLNKHAEANTVEKLLTMLESGDERRECASAVALRYLAMGKKAFVRDSEKVRNALAAELLSPKVKVRQEAAYALSYIAGEGQLEQLMAALDDEDRAVCCYAAIAIRCMKPEIAARAVPKLLEKLLDCLLVSVHDWPMALIVLQKGISTLF